MRRIISFLICLLVCVSTTFAGQKTSADIKQHQQDSLHCPQTFAYAKHDTVLHLDIYQPAAAANGFTVIHIFGGGFAAGSRTNKWDVAYCRQLAAEGYRAVAIDYRLGLRGATNVGMQTIKLLENAIYIAVEDCSAAVAWLCENAATLGIDTSKVIIEGSSAGAITALMTDYARCNKLDCAAVLPPAWKPAAVIAYSGAIFSRKGKPSWDYSMPAPTLLFHGTVDKVVTYKKIELFNTGFYGSNAIVKSLKKYNLPFAIYRYTDLGHEVSVGGPLTISELNLFVKQYVTDSRKLHADITITDDSIPPSEYSKMTVRQLYKHKDKKK